MTPYIADLLDRLNAEPGLPTEAASALQVLALVTDRLEAENARLRHAERRFTEERVAGLRREVEAARERVAGLEGDLASAERWLSGGAPEPLETVVPLRGRLYQRARPGWECASVSPSGRRCVLLAHHNGMHSDGTVGWYLPRHPVTPG